MRTRSGAPRTIVACAVVGAMASGIVAGGALLRPADADAQALCLPIVCTPAPVPTAPAPAPAPLPVPADAGTTVPASVTSQVTDHVDPQHTSYAADADLAPPLAVRWTRRLEGIPGPVVAGDGRMFAGVGDTVRAYDTGTGKTLWTVPGRAARLGYDGGRVVVYDGSGLAARSAADGRELWRLPLSTLGSLSELVATAGRIYAVVHADTSRTVALDGATGRPVWSARTRESDFVVVDQDRVYGQSGCGVSAIRRSTGEPLWATAGGCRNTGTGPPSVFAGRFFEPAEGGVLDTAGGTPVGTTGIPAGTASGVFGRGMGIHLIDGDQRVLLRARRGGTGRVAWTRTVSRNDRAYDRSAPVGIDDVVYVVVGNELSGYTIRGGRLVVRGTLKGPLSGDEAGRPRIVPLGGGRMLVSFGSRSYGVQSVLRPGPREVSAAPTATDVYVGPRSVVQGRVGARLGRPRVLVQADPAPAGGGWRTVARVRPGADGRFTARVRLDRNSRLRVRAAGRTSAAGTVFVYPRLTLRLAGAGRTHFRARYRVRGPRTRSLRGRRMALYLNPKGGTLYRRIAVGRLTRGRAGRFAGSVRVRRLARVRDSDRFQVCLVGGPRLGLGRGTFEERCGRARIRVR